jgi:hypothetical protein
MKRMRKSFLYKKGDIVATKEPSTKYCIIESASNDKYKVTVLLSDSGIWYRTKMQATLTQQVIRPLNEIFVEKIKRQLEAEEQAGALYEWLKR